MNAFNPITIWCDTFAPVIPFNIPTKTSSQRVVTEFKVPVGEVNISLVPAVETSIKEPDSVILKKGPTKKEKKGPDTF